MTTLHHDLDADGILTLTIDVPGRSMNLFTAELGAELATAIAAFRDDDGVKGVLIASGKRAGFMAGADLAAMASLVATGGQAERQAERARIFARVFAMNALLRTLETCGKPVACAIEGLALGGGLELCLATHHRVCADDPKLRLGLPEVLVGLLPGGGGTQRLPRLIGVQAALPLLLRGKSMAPREALKLGVVDELAAAGETLARARAWLRANPARFTQPWDEPGFKFPGGAGSLNPHFAQSFVGANALTHKTVGDNLHAPVALLAAVYEGAQLPMDTALRVESKYFTKVISDPQAHNMIRTLFVSKQEAEKGGRRPAQIEKTKIGKIGIVGAGLMGAGIAMAAAEAGIEVILIDRDLATAERGKAYTASRLAKTESEPEAIAASLAQIRPSADYAALAGCDLVIEAVYEDPAIKADVIGKIAGVLGAEAILGSNTSMLPITGLAASWSRPETFIGIHFFSPAEKMPLLEIITGKHTGAAAVGRALDLAAALRKIPIVVKDSRGFYTSRCFATYVQEGINLLAEGVAPALIENIARQIGMPVGPLAVSDEVGLDLSLKISEQARHDLGEAYTWSASDIVLETMNKLGRLGRKNGKGFYAYPKDGPKHLWPALSQSVAHDAPINPTTPAALGERLLFRQLVECLRCHEEGVLATPRDGDLGAVFGWGFAPHTGGPFSHADTIGAPRLVAVLDDLARRHGERFTPPRQLRAMAAQGGSYYSGARPAVAAPPPVGQILPPR